MKKRTYTRLFMCCIVFFILKNIRIFIAIAIAIAMLLQFGSLQAQNMLAPELLHVHFDKDFYLAGEDMWYSVYFTNPDYRQSEIVHIELLGPEGQLIRKQLLKVEDHKAIGDLALPPGLKEGYYLFRAYTKLNLNFSPQVIFSHHIPIYEFSFNERETEDEVATTSANSTENNPVQLVTIESDKSLYNPRENIRLTIAMGNHALKNGYGSIAIANQKYMHAQSIKNITESERDMMAYRFDPSKKIEIEKDMFRSFRILNPVTERPIKSSFIAGYVKQTKQRIISQTMDGTVRVRFDAFYDSSIVQLFDANPFVVEYSPLVSEIREKIPVEPPKTRNDLPPVTVEVATYIDFYKKRFHLNNLFGNLSNMRASQPEIKEAVLTPTYTYNVDEFIEFEDTYSFIKESVKAFKIKKYRQYIAKGNSKNESEALNAVLQRLPVPDYYFKLYVPNSGNRQRSAKRNPLLIVNDYLTYNADAILRMNIKNLKTIEIFSDISNLPLQFGPIGNYGVIKFETKTGQTSSEIANTTNNLKIEGFYLPRDFSLPTHQGFEKGVSRIPNLRPMMYWNPDIKITPQSALEINISANDVPGDYLIRLEGMLEDGTPFYAEKVLTIEAKQKAD